MFRRFVTSVLLLLIVLGAAAALNPSPQRHRDAIRERIGERSTLERVLGVGAVTAFLSSYRSIGIASYTVINGRVMSIGAFGVVIVIDE